MESANTRLIEFITSGIITTGITAAMVDRSIGISAREGMSWAGTATDGAGKTTGKAVTDMDRAGLKVMAGGTGNRQY